MEKLSVVGLGKLGCPLMAVFAEKGFDVMGVDVNSEIVDQVNAGKAPFVEPMLQELLSRNTNRIHATTNLRKAVLETEATFIILPTPSKSDHFFDNSYVQKALYDIGNVLADKDSYHLVVITSTVMPGSTESVLADTLADAAGKPIGDEIGLCYNPEFIALGTVVKDMLQPDILLIGESDKKAGDMLESIYSKSVETDPKVHRLNFVNAELAKISVNTYVTTKISYANMLAEMCENIPNADVDAVTNAIGDDSRIGKKYIKGGIAYGGPCFPRDNLAFASLGRSVNANTQLAESTDAINEHQALRLLNVVRSSASKTKPILLLGVSYKPNTPIFEESQALKLASALIEEGYEIILSDPEVSADQINPGFSFERNWSEALSSAGAIVLMTPWQEYSALPSKLNELGDVDCIIIDSWRQFNENSFGENITLVSMGRGGITR
jgi:UDPglucose 6-dehydrogenase